MRLQPLHLHQCASCGSFVPTGACHFKGVAGLVNGRAVGGLLHGDTTALHLGARANFVHLRRQCSAVFLAGPGSFAFSIGHLLRCGQPLGLGLSQCDDAALGLQIGPRHGGQFFGCGLVRARLNSRRICHHCRRPGLGRSLLRLLLAQLNQRFEFGNLFAARFVHSSRHAKLALHAVELGFQTGQLIGVGLGQRLRGLGCRTGGCCSRCALLLFRAKSRDKLQRGFAFSLAGCHVFLCERDALCNAVEHLLVAVLQPDPIATAGSGLGTSRLGRIARLGQRDASGSGCAVSAMLGSVMTGTAGAVVRPGGGATVSTKHAVHSAATVWVGAGTAVNARIATLMTPPGIE